MALAVQQSNVAGCMWHVQLKVARVFWVRGRLAAASKGMLRLVLSSGGARFGEVHLKLQMGVCNVAFWAAALADAQHCSLGLWEESDSWATTEHIAQLAAAVPGGTLPGIIALTVKVSSCPQMPIPQV
jgi:hypothetical protein